MPVMTLYVAAAVLGFSFWLYLAYVSLVSSKKRFGHLKKRNATFRNADEKFSIHEPYIIQGQASHTRFLPTLHHFLYSYLVVGIPVRSMKSNWILSMDVKNWYRKGWLTVDADDLLVRGHNDGGLEAKLDRYLVSQDLVPSDFPVVFLVTSPRFLTYKLSPVSFWYLYDRENTLKHMIAEVHNTFGERRLYLLSPSKDGLPSANGNDTAGPRRQPSPTATEVPKRFRYTWQKDFHVSPFSSRDGEYTLTAADIVAYDKYTMADRQANKSPIDITAILVEKTGRPRLVARLWSAEKPLDPSRMSIWSALLLFVKHWWVGLATFPRIVFVALKLAWIYKISIWYRPEPNRLTISRVASIYEQYIARTFISYLQTLVAGSSQPFKLECNFPVPPYRGLTLITPRAPSNCPKYTLRVLTPRFFAQLLTFSSLRELLEYVVMEPHMENRTAEIDQPHILIDLLTTPQGLELATPVSAAMKSPKKSRSISNKVMRVALDYIRPTSPVKGVYPSPALPESRSRTQNRAGGDKLSTGAGAVLTRGRQTHFLDDFTTQYLDASDQAEYYWSAFRTLLRLRFWGIIGGE